MGTAAAGYRTREKTPGRTGPGPRPRLRRRWLLAGAAVAASAAVITGIVVTAGSHGSPRSLSGWPSSTGFSVYTRPYLVNGTIYVGNTQRSRVRAERQHRRVPVEISARRGDRRRVLPPRRGRPSGLRGQRQRPYLCDQGPGRGGRLVEPVRRERRCRPVQPGLLSMG
jgi:hypothetical protein